MERHVNLKKWNFLKFFIVYLSIILIIPPISFAQKRNDHLIEVGIKQLRPLFVKYILSNSPWPKNSIIIRNVKAYPSKVSVPKGNIKIERQPYFGNPLGMVSLLYVIKVNNKIVRSIRVIGLVQVFQKVICAARTLSRGHLLSANDIKVIKMPLSRIQGNAIVDKKLAIGMVLKQYVMAGQVITKNMIREPVIIHKGDKVTIVAQNPYITIRATGLACQDGSKGKLVWVKNLSSNRQILAKVVGPNTVVVTF